MYDRDFENQMRESIIIGKVEERLGIESAAVAAILGFMAFVAILVVFGFSDALGWSSFKTIAYIVGVSLTAVLLGFSTIFLNRHINYEKLKNVL